MPKDKRLSSRTIRRHARMRMLQHLEDIAQLNNRSASSSHSPSFRLERDTSSSPSRSVQLNETQNGDSEFSRNDVNLDMLVDYDKAHSFRDYTKLSDSDTSVNSDPTEHHEADLLSSLCNWALNCQFSHSALTKLLGILKPFHPMLPHDSRTLLKTTKAVYNVKRDSSDSSEISNRTQNSYEGQASHTTSINSLQKSVSHCAEVVDEDISLSGTEIKGMLQKALAGIEVLKMQQANTHMLVESALKKPNADQRHVCEPPGDVSLPMNSQEDVYKMEKVLEENDKSKQLVMFFGSIGGKDVPTTVRRLMSQILTNTLAKQYNMTGRHFKSAFRELRLLKMIQNGVRKNHTLSTATNVEIDAAVADWLKYARDRDGGRSRRGREGKH